MNAPLILGEYDGTIVRTSVLSPQGEHVISRAAGEVTGESSCWHSALPAFRILCFLYLLCCSADIWHRCSGTHYSRALLQELSSPVPYRRMTMAFMRIISPLISSSTTLLAAIIICVRDGCFVFELCCSCICSCFVSHWVSSQETRILSHEFYSCGLVVSAVCSVSLRCVPLEFPSRETRVLFLGLVRMLLVRVCSVLSVPWPVFIDMRAHCTGTENDLTGPAGQSPEEMTRGETGVRSRQPKDQHPRPD